MCHWKMDVCDSRFAARMGSSVQATDIIEQSGKISTVMARGAVEREKRAIAQIIKKNA